MRLDWFGWIFDQIDDKFVVNSIENVIKSIILTYENSWRMHKFGVPVKLTEIDMLRNVVVEACKTEYSAHI